MVLCKRWALKYLLNEWKCPKRYLESWQAEIDSENLSVWMKKDDQKQRNGVFLEVFGWQQTVQFSLSVE